MKQSELLNRLAKEFVKAKGDVTPLVMCPTEDSQRTGWFWIRPETGIIGRTHHERCNICLLYTSDPCDAEDATHGNAIHYSLRLAAAIISDHRKDCQTRCV